MKTVREAARARQALDGADAQALEHALTMTEQERDRFSRKLVPAGVLLSILCPKFGMTEDEMVSMLNSIEEKFGGAKIGDPDIEEKMQNFLDEFLK